jgi:hypothetical protein
MSRNYSVEFMTEEDHETIYQEYSKAPTANEVTGRWEGKLVSDSALTPVSHELIIPKIILENCRCNILLEDY